MIYLDYNATTPADPRVIEAMLPWFHKHPGNPSSRSHHLGWEAEEAVEQARRDIAELIGADDREVFFTSGATESDNLAIKGIFERYGQKGRHIVSVNTEHPAVLEPLAELEKRGGSVTILSVEENGLVDLCQLDQAIRDDTVLVSIMWANNETGVIQPMAKIGELCHRRGVLLMSDAAQAFGKIPIDVRAAGVHLLSLSGHKMYGPKGIGALYIRRRSPRVSVAPQLHGGGQQGGIRPGTLNVPGIVGFGKAAALAKTSMAAESARLAILRDSLEETLSKELPALKFNGDRHHRLPHVANISFTGVSADALLLACSGHLALSTGSACSSATPEPSHVLRAMGVGQHRAESALRFSLGRFTTAEEIDATIGLISESVSQLRAKSAVWDLYQDGVDLD